MRFAHAAVPSRHTAVPRIARLNSSARVTSSNHLHPRSLYRRHQCRWARRHTPLCIIRVRLAGRAANQVRAGAQYRGRQGARPRRAGKAARARRRGNRMTRRELFVPRQMGTSCTKSVWDGPSQTLWIRHSFAPLHSITSSARASSVGGTSMPSAFAVVRFTTRSNLVGCSTGRSAGFAPRRILSV